MVLPKYVVLIMQKIIYREIILNTDDQRQERDNEGPILNFHKSHFRHSLNKTFGAHVEKSMVFKILKK